MNEIENVSDQLTGFALEVAQCVKEIESNGFTPDQAIEITKIAVEDIRIDLEQRRNKRLGEIADALSEIANAIGFR